jgi:hypothetical protein
VAHGLIAHGPEQFDVSKRVDKWLEALDERPQYVSAENAALDLAIFQDPAYNAPESDETKNVGAVEGTSTLNQEVSRGGTRGTSVTTEAHGSKATTPGEIKAIALAEHKRAVQEAITGQSSARGERSMADRPNVSALENKTRDEDPPADHPIEQHPQVVDLCSDDAEGSEDNGTRSPHAN